MVAGDDDDPDTLVADTFEDDYTRWATRPGSFRQVAANFLDRHVRAKDEELRTHGEIERIINK